MQLTTTRLTLQPLSAAQLAFYIQDNQQLEQQLQLLPGSRQVPDRLKKKIAETIIPAVTKAGDQFLFHTFWIVIDTSSKTIVADICFKARPVLMAKWRSAMALTPLTRAKD